ncbi:MAG: hypothetical protein WB420_22185 [Bradyrhizobium sp.]
MRWLTEIRSKQLTRPAYANGAQTNPGQVDLFVVSGICTLQHFAVERGGPMFLPFFSTVSLAFESGNVIGLRMMKMMSGGSGSHDEAHLMVTEKLSAMFEASASLMSGATASSVVERYREHVAANAKRLSR